MVVEGRQQTKRKKPYPFSGLRVLDFGIGAVGVEMGRLFAEYGADVIKVESAANPDRWDGSSVRVIQSEQA